MASSYGNRWDAPASGQGFRSTTTAWDLRWWIIAAVGTSIGVHAALLVWMRNYRIPEAAQTPAELRTGVFETELEQITIPQQVLQPMENMDPDLTRKMQQAPPPLELPDISQIAEELKDKAVVLSPSLKDMAVNVTLSKPASGSAGDIVDDLSHTKSALDVDVSKSLLAKSTTIQPSAMKPDDDQMVIDVNALDSTKGDAKGDILRSMKKGDGGNNGLDGFTSLDDLVNYQGPITQDFKTMLRTDLLFDFGSAQLRSEARLSLMKLGMIIQTNSGAQFRLVGHTDTIGDEASNQKLSEARAAAVKDWLVDSLKLDGSHIIVEGRGEKEPLPDVPANGDAAAQQPNRRVEIHKTGN
jgi:outer membrane protein OmpA-like peptidoglycan-associated protein